MDDSCAVCAETLEWVAYGPCGHKDVCSTCVARLRFICDDRRCCICKTESNSVFVTKALGDYTRNIGDFSVFPTQVKDGRVGSYWYHEDTQAFFDDLDHYKMIKAMCRLSCSECDKMDEQPNGGSRRRARFRNIDQLKGHLFHQHKLIMCGLCLEGRKVFICEQKLYTRAQLNQHINTGDSEVDGSESERGGFMGHPICEFCRIPFYGDNELYSHMSTEHYTCHICQRQHPGQYEYYKNYDDLEMHFRRDHFLCEDEACLAKKFIVFQSESEMKRHNALEHGGQMSRSKRIAALQIPTSFRYRRHSEETSRRGRAQSFFRDNSENELSMAIQASLQMANSDGRVISGSSSSSRPVLDHRETGTVDPLITPSEPVAATDTEPASRYLEAVSHHAKNSQLEESSFPPLAPAATNTQQRSQTDNSVSKTMAARLRRQNKVNVLNSAPSSTSANHRTAPSASTPQRGWPALNNTSGPSSSSGQVKSVNENGSQRAWPALSIGSGSTTNSGQAKAMIENRVTSSGLAKSLQGREPPPPGFYGSALSSGSSSRITHAASAPNLVQNGSFPSTSDFPPVSAVQLRKTPGSSQTMPKVEDVRTANKSLVERIRIALNFDEDKYTSFKSISGEYRQGLMDAETYLVYVEQFGLSHLVTELARLCPDPGKQTELVETYKANLVMNVSQSNSWNNNTNLKESSKTSKKGKGKSVDTRNNTSRADLEDNFLRTVRELQVGYNHAEKDAEVLSKDGYRDANDKVKLVIDKSNAGGTSSGESSKLKGQTNSLDVNGGSSQMAINNGKGKQRKKTSKFHRLRLGEESAQAIINQENSESDQDTDSKDIGPKGHDDTTGALPVRGVWRNSGGQKLFTSTGRGSKQ
ncbi:ubiquitin-protein ligase [Lithospermum erythrorhizon]|uniref:RING-type E3 ubiquitin transferase n=1 Tax=Lithospermum erythrorhizon TaxID=34254 RepID=A0AAV3P4J3_LITER